MLRSKGIARFNLEWRLRACIDCFNGVGRAWLWRASYQRIIERIDGLTTTRSDLPSSWFALYDYGAGFVIQSGPKANPADVNVDVKTATYVLTNMRLKEVRAPEVGSLHNGAKDDESRIVGWEADQWLKFDVNVAELLDYKRANEVVRPRPLLAPVSLVAATGILTYSGAFDWLDSAASRRLSLNIFAKSIEVRPKNNENTLL